MRKHPKKQQKLGPDLKKLFMLNSNGHEGSTVLKTKMLKDKKKIFSEYDQEIKQSQTADKLLKKDCPSIITLHLAF